MTTRTWTRALSRKRRVLYLSSPIGLGHAMRDLAIARELRDLHPDVEIDWLAQHPVTAVLETHGERIHPAEQGAGLGERPHRGRGGGSRPQRVPGDPAHGRDPRRELHGVPRRDRGRRVRPRGRGRGVGRRPLPAREPGAQAHGVRVDDRLRGLAADARRRRARGVPHRRLQRRDDRARGALPADPRHGGLRRHAGRHRPGLVRARAAGHPAVDRGALRVQRLRDGLRPRAAHRAAGRAARGARLPAGRAGRDRRGRRQRGGGGAARAGSSPRTTEAARLVPGCG